MAALRDSIFQGELLMSEANSCALFPEQEGYRFLLVERRRSAAAAVLDELENALRDFGADATTTGERLAQFHRVENTYLSTFQTLGGLGLLLGTVGSPRSCFGTCSSAGGNWRSSARSGTAGAMFS